MNDPANLDYHSQGIELCNAFLCAVGGRSVLRGRTTFARYFQRIQFVQLEFAPGPLTITNENLLGLRIPFGAFKSFDGGAIDVLKV